LGRARMGEVGAFYAITGELTRGRLSGTIAAL